MKSKVLVKKKWAYFIKINQRYSLLFNLFKFSCIILSLSNEFHLMIQIASHSVIWPSPTYLMFLIQGSKLSNCSFIFPKLPNLFNPLPQRQVSPVFKAFLTHKIKLSLLVNYWNVLSDKLLSTWKNVVIKIRLLKSS